MIDALAKIPKGVNLLLFVWAALAVYATIRSGEFRRKKELKLFYWIAFFMIVWRILIRIITSRYAAALIIPLAFFSSLYLCNPFRKKHLLAKLAWTAIFVCTGFIYLKMNFDSLSRYDYSSLVAETFDRYQYSKNDCMFSVRNTEYNRISYLSRIPFKRFVNPKQPLKEHLRQTLSDILLNYQVKTDENELRGEQGLGTVAFFPQSSSKKQLVCIYTTQNRAKPVSEANRPPYSPNLLQNGDVETLLSPEEPRAVPDEGAENESAPDGSREQIQIPAGTILCSGQEPGTEPEFTATDDSNEVIDGSRSVRIRQESGDVSFFFSQGFANGTYRYSMLVRGTPGTRIAAVRRSGREEETNVQTISTFVIPDRRLFEISCYFTVDDLKDDETFGVGVNLSGGEAVFDNFSVAKPEQP